MKKKFLLRLLNITAVIILITAMLVHVISDGTTKNDIMGTWVTEANGDSIGFQCGKSGIAASVGDCHRQYTSWQLRRNSIILAGKNFADGTVTPFSDTLIIKSLSPTSLSASLNGITVKYVKIR